MENDITAAASNSMPSRHDLAMAVDVAEWSWLRAHLERGGLIVVDDSLDIVDAAIKLAEDDAETVAAWIHSGRIGKPTMKDIQSWDSDKEKRFSMLIISPFILMQSKEPTVH